MKKVLGVLFALLACGQFVPLYAVVKSLLEARYGDEESGAETMSGLLGLSIGVPLLMVFSAAALWCFQKRRSRGRWQGNGLRLPANRRRRGCRRSQEEG